MLEGVVFVFPDSCSFFFCLPCKLSFGYFSGFGLDFFGMSDGVYRRASFIHAHFYGKAFCSPPFCFKQSEGYMYVGKTGCSNREA